MQWVEEKPSAFDILLLYTLEKEGGVVSRGSWEFIASDREE